MKSSARLRVEPARQRENEIVELPKEDVELFMVNKVMVPHAGDIMADYLEEYAAALEPFWLSDYINRFTNRDDVSNLIWTMVECLVSDESGQLHFDQTNGLFLFSASVGEERQHGIRIDTFYKTRFFPLIMAISREAIKHGVMIDCWKEYSDSAEDMLLVEIDSVSEQEDEDYARSSLKEDWMQRWFSKFMNKWLNLESTSIASCASKLKLPTQVLDRVNLLAVALEEYGQKAKGVNRIGAYWLDENYDDANLHPVYWSRNSDYLMNHMDTCIDSIHNEGYVHEYGITLGVENGKVYIDESERDLYVSRYELRKQITECVESLTLLLTPVQRSRSNLPPVSPEQEQP